MLRRICGIVVTIALASCSDSNAPPASNCGETQPDPECHTIAVGGVTREYLLHVPASFSTSTGSLVIALHGVGDLGSDLRAETGLSAKADAAGFAIAYPNALLAPLSGFPEWNVYFAGYFGPNPPDDVAFLRKLIATLQQRLHADPKRIYVTGLSNGALMAHRVGVEMGDVVAAVAVVSGTLATSTATTLVPDVTQSVSVLMIHGDQDDNVPCCPFRAAASQDDSFDYWVSSRANACVNVSTTERICSGPETPSPLPEKHATGCRNGVEVRFYKLLGGMHHWYKVPMNVAGQAPYNPFFDGTTGVTTTDIVWNFFAAHPKP